MRNLKDRDVANLAREVSRVTPVAADAREAVAAVRRQLHDCAPAPRHGALRLLLVSGGIAAAIALACGTVLLLQPRPLSAAEALQASTQATEAYRGWIHMAPDTPFPLQVQNGMELSLRGAHFNNANGTSIIVCDIQKTPFIQMISPTLKKQFLYTGMTHELRIAPLNKTWGAPWEGVPLNLADMLTRIKNSAGGGTSPDVRQSTDGDLQRFDLSYEDATRKKKVQETIWVDPKTKLIQKMAAPVQTQAGDKMLEMKYTYGNPQIKDIYDAGVPRDAHVTEEVADTRPGNPPVATTPDVSALVKDKSQDAAAIVARLQKRREKDFGDFVELHCEQIKHLRYNQPEQGAITLIAKSGDKAVSAHYLVAPLAVLIGGPGFPQHWPQPSLDEALSVMKTAMPTTMEVHNGADVWQSQQQYKMGFQLGPSFWTLPQTLSISTNGKEMVETHPEVLRDPAHPDLLVLHTESRLPMPFMSAANYHADIFVWIDPAHDDLPVESLQRTNSKTDELDSSIHQVVLEFGRLKDGSWFPAHWQYKTARPTEPGVVDDGYVENWRQFFPENALPAEWYENPTQRLSKIKPLFVPSSQPAATRP